MTFSDPSLVHGAAPLVVAATLVWLDQDARTGDRATGQLLGVQLFGHRHVEIAKRIDIAATAIFNEMTVDAMSELDLSYTPPLGSPWDAVQMGAQAWVKAV